MKIGIVQISFKKDEMKGESYLSMNIETFLLQCTTVKKEKKILNDVVNYYS